MSPPADPPLWSESERRVVPRRRTSMEAWLWWEDGSGPRSDSVRTVDVSSLGFYYYTRARGAPPRLTPMRFRIRVPASVTGSKSDGFVGGDGHVIRIDRALDALGGLVGIAVQAARPFDFRWSFEIGTAPRF